MAKKGSSQGKSSVEQFGPRSGSESQAGKIIEFDPEAPMPAAAPAFAMDEIGESADTIHVEDDFFAARDELLDRLSAPRAQAFAMSLSAPEARQSRVLGVGVAFKRVGGTLTGEVAIQVLVEMKLPRESIAPGLAIPSTLAGLPTDVEEVGSIFPHSFSSRYQRPVPCGVSCGEVDITAGTIGCLVVRNNGHLCILSNNHVLANCNRGVAGDFIVQPGPADGGQTPADVIATLEDFVPLDPVNVNSVDAAVAFTSFKLVSPNHVTYKVSSQPMVAALGMTVIKNGRTTDSTLGTITGMGFNGVQVPYPNGVGLCTFRDQIVISGVGGVFSRPGDSGSLIVTANTKQPVGLLFAGSANNAHTFANPIATVMQALDIREIVPGR